ncbi:MAG: hypothetical protein ACI35P_01655 [Bacillus sp. (in: firmicutes)]
MQIGRLNADFGNSAGNFLVDGYYFEMPTNVVPIEKGKAEGHFISDVTEAADLLDRLLISTKLDGEEEERYFMVGRLAEGEAMANVHVNEMHDKISSHVPYAMFLAAVAYNYCVKSPERKDQDEIEIERMKMMLPIWLLTREEKFAVATKKMAARFEGEHTVKLLTKGMETELKISVKNSECRIEGEVSRWSLRYKMVNKDNVTQIVPRPEAGIFNDFRAVLVDIGGGSTDAVLLAKGLQAPVSKDSFQVISISPFLGALDKLRKDKLLEYFKDLRTLEQFVVANHKTQKYVYRNPNNGARADLTEQITSMLREYAGELVYKVINTFARQTDDVLKFVYFGGEAPILEPYIKERVADLTTEEIANQNHLFLHEFLEMDENQVFPPVSRTINLASLELLSVNQKTTA